jgi:hypothetical protein
VFIFEEGHDAAGRETIGEGTQHGLDVGLVHQHQPADDRVERPRRRGRNVTGFESNV